MMKNSAILKWTNSKNKLLGGNNKNGTRSWLHPPDALQKGHIAYFVKYLGNTEVEQPKGLEIVKEAIQKLKFMQQLMKAEGTKIQKVDLTISVDGVAIQDRKTKKNAHQYPLHRISYCADDKAEKRFFSFIAKEAESETHTCHVFVSDKLAEEITLTIGQAFDLAYKHFLETSGRELDLRRQVSSLQKRIELLETENGTLKTRLTQMSSLKDRVDVEKYLKENCISDLLILNGETSDSASIESPSPIPDSKILADLPPVPPRNIVQNGSSFITTSSGCGDSDDDFNPRAEENASSLGNTSLSEEDEFDPRAEEKKKSEVPPMNGYSAPLPLIPPPRPARHGENLSNGDLVNQIFNSTESPFSTNASVGEIPDPMDKFSEMRAGFNRGLSFGTVNDDFSLESLDPLKN